MTDLITTDEASTFLQLTDPDLDRLGQAITRVSSRVQRYCNRVSLTQVEDDEITMAGSYSYELPLPKGPVTEVSAVTVDGSSVSDWDLVKDKLIRSSLDDASPFVTPTTPHWGGPHVVVAVTYTHGFATVPDEVKDVCFDLLAMAWHNPTGVRSQAIDGYSVTFGGTRGSDVDPLTRLAGWHRSSGSVRLG